MSRNLSSSQLFVSPSLVLPPAETPDASEGRLRLRDAQLAAYFGLATSWITDVRGRNPAYWDHLERRWMQETHGSLAPQHLLAVQAREDRARVREQARAARRLAFCIPPPAAPKADASPSQWSRLGTAVMDWLCRHQSLQTHCMGWAMGLLAASLALGQIYPGFWTEVLTILGVGQ